MKHLQALPATERVGALLIELKAGQHRETFGDELDGNSPRDLAGEFLMYYEEEQFGLLADMLGIGASEVIDEMERIAQRPAE